VTQVPEFDLRRYLGVLRRRWAAIMLSVIIAVAAALGISLAQSKVYEARAEMIIRDQAAGSLLDALGSRSVYPERELQNEIRILQSQAVRQAVAQTLGTAPAIDAEVVAGTDVIALTSRASDPQEAAEAVNTYARTYLEYRQENIVTGLQAAENVIRSERDRLQQEIDDLLTPVRALEGQIADSEPGDVRNSAEADLAELNEKLTSAQQSLQTQIDEYDDQLEELDLSANISATGGPALINPGTVPSDPVSPTPLRDGLLAMTLGLVVGITIAVAKEFLDDTIKGKDDLQLATGDAKTLGLIPVVSGWKQRSKAWLVTSDAPTSPASEAYRTLRTALSFLALERPLRIIQITSPSAGEGKTTTLANLAVVLSQAGRKVVVVCCDLRRPRIHDFFSLSNKIGFTSVLLGETPLSAAVQPVEEHPGLSLLASGPIPPNPSELLSGVRAHEVLQALLDSHDVVLLDTPPVLPVTDAIVVSAAVDATLLVAAVGATTKRQTHRAVELLTQAQSPFVGTVLNGATNDEGYGTSYDGLYHANDSNGKKINGAHSRKSINLKGKLPIGS
jgi:non-specific protein-tyrosine kinase